MTKRNNPKDISSVSDLVDLDKVIVDKRNHKRSDAKKNRRNRHYEKQFIKNAVNDLKQSTTTLNEDPEND